MVIIHGNIHPATSAPIADGFVRFDAGKITAVGPMADYAPVPGEEVFDVAGQFVMPGMVDAHCHIGLIGDSLGFEGNDVNEITNPATPHLRAIDGINPLDRCFSEALAAGVTTVVTLPGSANPIGGQAAAIKTFGRRVDDMVLRAPAAMKFALGENPKRCYNGRHETPTTRMGTAAVIREQLFRARDYMRKLDRAAENPDAEKPAFDMKCEALVPVLRREVQAHFHAHRADDIFTAIRIAKEFDLDYVIVHGTEGHLVPDLIAAEGARVITGPHFGARTKPEITNKSFSAPGILVRAGVQVAICTDHNVTPLQHLPLCAALAVRSGMDEEDALRAITCNPARIVNLADRVGALEVGLDADIVVLTGSPFEIASQTSAVFVSGEQVL